jgi:hypothetical protein
MHNTASAANRAGHNLFEDYAVRITACRLLTDSLYGLTFENSQPDLRLFRCLPSDILYQIMAPHMHAGSRSLTRPPAGD